MKATEMIQELQLQQHPEGGFFKETYRSSGTMLINGNERNFMTCIYYLLEGKQKSMFHRLKSDELWLFHHGSALEIVVIDDGKATSTILGNNIAKAESPQLLIPANTWFAARVKNEEGFALVSCVVSPGFDFNDFEMADRDSLARQYPSQKDTIELFTL
jgi:uncharacterized protein